MIGTLWAHKTREIVAEIVSADDCTLRMRVVGSSNPHIPMWHELDQNADCLHRFWQVAGGAVLPSPFRGEGFLGCLCRHTAYPVAPKEIPPPCRFMTQAQVRG